MRKWMFSPTVLFVLSMVPRLALADEPAAAPTPMPALAPAPNWAIPYRADPTCEEQAKSGRGLVAGGGVLLGIGYGAVATTGVVAFYGSPLMLAAHLVPVIGPLGMAFALFAAGTGEFGGLAIGLGVAYLLDAGMQAAGIALVAVGATKIRHARPVRMSFAPFVTNTQASGTTAGVGVIGRF